MKESKMFGNNLYLVENNEDLSELIKEFKSLDRKKRVGLDTETTGLDFVKDKIAGVCLGYKDKTTYKGWYLPIAHNGHDNLDHTRVLKFTRWIIYNFVTVLFNRGFDFGMLENEVIADGTKIEIDHNVRSHDVQIMAYNATSKTLPSLKDSYKEYCNKEIPTFLQTVSKGKAVDYNFANTDPYLTYTYGAMDPIATLELGEAIQRKCPYIKKIYPLDNLAAETIRRQTRIQITVDYKEVARVKEELEYELREITAKAFSITGYSFNLNSNRDKGEALSRFVTLTTKTKGGALSVKAETLERIDHPLAKLMVDYASVKKLIGSYVESLETTKNKSTRIKYNMCAAPTGRLSSGGAKNNTYFMDYNIQAVPKKEEKLFVHSHPQLGLCLKKEEEGALGTSITKSGLRRMFNAPEGYLWFTADYKTQELRIVANLANERSWIDAFKAGRDIHMEVAKLAFGVETSKARGDAKSVSFGTIYGMSVYSLAKKLSCSVQQAEAITDAYFGALQNLKKWIKHIKLEARKRGIVYTMFGRPRVLKEYFNTSDPKKVAFGERSAVNSPVQGSGSDILRMALIRIDRWIRSENLEDRIMVCNNVYDEINFYVRYDSVDLATENIPRLMEIEIEGGVNIEVDAGIGTSWGTVLDHPILKNGKIFDAESIHWFEGKKEQYQATFS